MSLFRKKVFLAAGYNTVYMGPGRKEFDPHKPLRPYEEYLLETAQGTCKQLQEPVFDEGILGSFMSARFLSQANLPGFLPFMIPDLKGKGCTGVEGACGTGGRALAIGVRGILSDLSDRVFVAAFEMQNTLKPVYGADVLAGASYYAKERKTGHAYFFPGVFAERAGVYYAQIGYDVARKGMATWYAQAIQNARKNPKAQEFHNTDPDPFLRGMTPPDPLHFIPFLNHADCSKISDGASSIVVLSEKGLLAAGIKKEETIELIALGEAQGDITRSPEDPTVFDTTQKAVAKALKQAGLKMEDIGVLEIHDCFTISALLSLEATGLAARGKAPAFILEGNTAPQGRIPTNLSGGLGGFGHPTGASGVRQAVDLWEQLTGKAPHPARLRTPYGMSISMGGNDKTVTCLIVKKAVS